LVHFHTCHSFSIASASRFLYILLALVFAGVICVLLEPHATAVTLSAWLDDRRVATRGAVCVSLWLLPL
jgi:hypothetical protein